MKKYLILLMTVVCLFCFNKTYADVYKEVKIKYEYKNEVNSISNKFENNHINFNSKEDNISIKVDKVYDKDLNVLIFEVSNEAIEWIKTKVSELDNIRVYCIMYMSNGKQVIPKENLQVKISNLSEKEKVVYLNNSGEIVETLNKDSKTYLVIGTPKVEDNNDIGTHEKYRRNINYYNSI